MLTREQIDAEQLRSKVAAYRQGVADYAAGKEPTTPIMEYHEGYSAAARLIEAAAARFERVEVDGG